VRCTPYLGSKPVAAITAQELLGALRRVEARGRHETAHRVRALPGRVLRYAVATGRAQHDVAADLEDALAPVKSRNVASETGPGELRAAEWSEFDLPNTEWRIPGLRMKMGESHIVPLAGRRLPSSASSSRWPGAGATCSRPFARDRTRVPVGGASGHDGRQQLIVKFRPRRD
jgi:integrase